MSKATLKLIVQSLELLSSIVLCFMMLLTFVDVVGRYFLGAPVFGASEIISTMLAVLIFLGLGIANSRDKHITVELIDGNIRNIAPRFYDVLIHGFSIFAMCLIVYVLYEQAVETHHVNSRTVVLELPLYWITGVIAFLAALSVISQILGLIVGIEPDNEEFPAEDF